METGRAVTWRRMRKPRAKTGAALDTEMHAHPCPRVCTDTRAFSLGPPTGKGGSEGSRVFGRWGLGWGSRREPVAVSRVSSRLRAQPRERSLSEVDSWTLTPCISCCPAWADQAWNQASSGLDYEAQLQCPRVSPVCLSSSACTFRPLCPQAPRRGHPGGAYTGWTEQTVNLDFQDDCHYPSEVI